MCGYGGIRTRAQIFNLVGEEGGMVCPGSVIEQEKCFEGCCDDQFDCHQSGKCIESRLSCNYIDDCGKNEDENDVFCEEHCET